MGLTRVVNRLKGYYRSTNLYLGPRTGSFNQLSNMQVSGGGGGGISPVFVDFLNSLTFLSNSKFLISNYYSMLCKSAGARSYPAV